MLRRDLLRQHYQDDHLIKRKFILSRAAFHWEKNRHEPAPLLGRQLLDIGCGTLGLGEQLTLRGAEVMAIDSNAEVLQHAEDMAKLSGTDVQFKQISFAEHAAQKENAHKYDVVLAYDVMSEAGDVPAFILDVKRVLKPDGIFVVGDWQEHWRTSFVHALLGMPKHATVDAQRTMKRIEAAGLKLDFVRYLHFSTRRNEWLKTETPDGRWLASFTYEQ